MNPDLPFEIWAGERQQRIEHVLDRILPPAEGATSTLAAAMRYATLGGGKRMRPLLAYAAGELPAPTPASSMAQRRRSS